ncbi:uncharacterized protein [Bemisia tabaci]|uniref:uncharacterized protein n=1 Tax=Bemisia tabaci TaxID=7038 RepID=UPI003B28369A
MGDCIVTGLAILRTPAGNPSLKGAMEMVTGFKAYEPPIEGADWALSRSEGSQSTRAHSEFKRWSSSWKVIVIGDLNGRTGHRIGWKVVGPFGEDVVNDNGNRIIAVCERNKLEILNGFFQHRDIHKDTWVKQTRGLRSIIDYAITNHTSKIKVRQVKVCRGLSCGSDHHFLKIEIAFPVKSFPQSVPRQQQQQQGERVQPKRYNIDSLHHQSVKDLYTKRLNEKLDERQGFCDAEDQYHFIKTCIHAAAREALGVREKITTECKSYWWDKEIEEEIDVKRRNYHSFLHSKSNEDKMAYKHAQAKVQRLIMRKIYESWENNCPRINTCLGGRGSTESWKLLKGLRRNMKKDILSPITISQLEDHFKVLRMEVRPEFQGSAAEYNAETLSLEVKLEEIVKAIKELKNEKAPAAGDIPSRLIKCGTRELFQLLGDLFDRCIKGARKYQKSGKSPGFQLYKTKERGMTAKTTGSYLS